MTIKPGFIIAILMVFLSPIWYFIALEVTNAKIWVVGYLILLALWITQFATIYYTGGWPKKLYVLQIILGIACFLPFLMDALTFLSWMIGGFAP